MQVIKKITAIFFVCFAFSCQCVLAQIRLPRLIRDSMVLQRDTKIRIWGWASPHEKVKVSLNGNKASAITGADGKWMLQLAPMKAGGPYTMQVSGSKTIVLKDILIGDVWFCSGQSNMVHQMELHRIRYAAEIAQANYPQIRQFRISALTDLNNTHDDLPDGNWKSANPEDVKQFSAVAYFFAKKLYDKYKVPIGIINSSVGGTPIEAWTSEEGLKDFPKVLATIHQNKDTGYINNINRNIAAYNAGTKLLPVKDMSLIAEPRWYDINYVAKGWRNINIPGYWEDQGVKDLNGVVWYRREFELPASVDGAAATVFLGRIVDADVLYINGKQVGTTGYQYPQRRYAVSAGLLKPGKNLFVIKVSNNSGKGGFVTDKPYSLFWGKDTIDLKGTWQYKVGEVFTAAPGPSFSAQNQPVALYNAMVSPVINYPVKGFVWYQGESNTGDAAAYDKLLPALIADWRSKWRQDSIPFLFAQLPGFMDMNYSPSESNWARLREAQLKALSVPNTGMAVTIDLGEWNDIHPDNKKDVGDRLALAAEKIVYGENIVYSGPLYQSSATEGNKIILSFTNTGSGLTSNDGEAIRQFAIAGADKKFVWANASIQGDKIIVWNDSIAQPMYTRYAWADNPADANLYNKEKLPASPFRTDK